MKPTTYYLGSGFKIYRKAGTIIIRPLIATIPLVPEKGGFWVADLLELTFAMLNVLLSGCGFLVIIAGIRWFETGLFVRTLKRAIPAAIILFLFFFTKVMAVINAVPANTPINDILGTCFIVAGFYVAYGLVGDWREIESELGTNPPRRL